ncbi:MAG: GNAT family N-acetyltransferase [Rhodanobacteraceae bacterium]
MPIHIRPATPADVPFLVDCNAAMAAETEGKSLARDVLKHGTQAVFADPRRGFYLIAECESAAAGCLLVTYEWSDWRNGDWWWIQSVYVVAGARRHGVFRALFSDVEQRANAAGAVGLRLYVERDNTRAQQTYAALGMREEPYKMLRRGFIEFSQERAGA